MAKQTLKLKDYYVDRDVSWMYFNRRILQEAQKDDVPLLERLSFLGIYSNNLDEFFRVRVASLSRLLEEPSLDKQSHHDVKKDLKMINKINEAFSLEYNETVAEVRARLEEHGIRIVDETEIDDAQKAFLRDFYYDKLNGNVNPIWLNAIDNIASLEDNRIYLVVERRELDNKDKVKYAIIKIPDRQAGRWVKLPSDDNMANIMYLDDAVRYCLPLIFLGMKPATYQAYSFKFTKDAEMDIDNDQDYGTLEKIRAGVESRKHGEAVRVLYDKNMPKEIQKKILERLDIDELDTSLAGGRYQNHKDLMSFPDCGHTELKYPKWQHIMKP